MSSTKLDAGRNQLVTCHVSRKTGKQFFQRRLAARLRSIARAGATRCGVPLRETVFEPEDTTGVSNFLGSRYAEFQDCNNQSNLSFIADGRRRINNVLNLIALLRQLHCVNNVQRETIKA
jgi:hypothetical protein